MAKHINELKGERHTDGRRGVDIWSGKKRLFQCECPLSELVTNLDRSNPRVKSNCISTQKSNLKKLSPKR